MNTFERFIIYRFTRKIKNKQCCIDVKNKDNKCFILSVLSALHHKDIKRNHDRVTK